MDKKLSGRISTKSQNDDALYHSEPAQNHYLPSSKQYLTENQDPRDQHESHQESESNILVALRVRPMIQKEVQTGEFDIIRVEDNLLIVLDPVELAHEAQNKPILDVLHRSKEQNFAFDKVFRDESQERIYSETCKNLIHPVLNGYNSCVFAYGTTGAGKTYTMLGNQQVPGIMLLTVKDIFETIRTHYSDKDFNIVVSYVEIYNETIRDLLVPSSGYLELRDDPNKGTMISGATEHKAESMEQIMNLLFLGNRRRTTEATNANQTSSRSHAVFQIQVNSSPKTRNIEVETVCGKLSLIDLAGSERGTVTENRGIRLREGAKINRSLLSLANCINALGDKTKKGFFVPYRDSKLTRLLKDSLGGNCKTVMIANISPASSQIEETLNTLKYANRARNIKTKVVSNKKLVTLHIAEYKNIINDLRQEIDELKGKLSEVNNANHAGLPPRPNYSAVPQDDISSSFILHNSYNQRDELSVRNEIQRNLNEDCPCSCGRDQDNIEVKRIQEELFENFQQRIQIRRALMELDDQNATNLLEMRRKKAEILDWEKNEIFGQKSSREEEQVRPMRNGFFKNEKRPLSACPDHIKKNYKSIKTLKFSTDQNTNKRNQLNIQLIENIAEAKKLKDSILKRVKHKDRKEYLELVIKNHLLELQNIEYEIHLKIQEKMIYDLKDIVQKQQKVLQENNIEQDEEIEWDDLEQEEAQSLQSKSVEENDINIDDLVYDDDPDNKSNASSSDADEGSEKRFFKKSRKEQKAETRRKHTTGNKDITERGDRRHSKPRGLVEAEINAFPPRKGRSQQDETGKRSGNERESSKQKDSLGLPNPSSRVYQSTGSRNLDDITERSREDLRLKDENSALDSANIRGTRLNSKSQQSDGLPFVPAQPRDRSNFDSKGRKTSVSGIHNSALPRKDEKMKLPPPAKPGHGGHPLPLINLLKEGKIKGNLNAAVNIYGAAALKDQKLFSKKSSS